MSPSTKASKTRNPVAVAMRLRYGKTTTNMKDRRTKRQNRHSWKQDVDSGS